MRAAARWLELLQRSSGDQAWALVRADAAYSDLTHTQYAEAMELLVRTALVGDVEVGGLGLSDESRDLRGGPLRELLLARTVQAAQPAWLADADLLLASPEDLPQDIARLATVLDLGDHAAAKVVRQVHGRINLERRAEVGRAGEAALALLLAKRWPGSVAHVALTDDGFGYDIAVTVAGTEWHLEVKTTTRRGRLVIYLSRHEHETALADPFWRLVVVGLAPDLTMLAVATVDYGRVVERSPNDVSSSGSWQSARHELSASDLGRSLPFLPDVSADMPGAEGELLSSGAIVGLSVAWLP